MQHTIKDSYSEMVPNTSSPPPFFLSLVIANTHQYLFSYPGCLSKGFPSKVCLLLKFIEEPVRFLRSTAGSLSGWHLSHDKPKYRMLWLCRGIDFGGLEVLTSAWSSVYKLTGDQEGLRVLTELSLGLLFYLDVQNQTQKMQDKLYIQNQERI